MPALEQVDGCWMFLVQIAAEGQLWMEVGPGWASPPRGQGQCVVVLEGAALSSVTCGHRTLFPEGQEACCVL